MSIQALENISTDVAVRKGDLFLGELDIGVTGTIIVMVCRVWDVNTVTGRYLSTDFIVSDSRGKAMHCTARNKIAHNFVKLKEGFDGTTTARKVSVMADDFERYLFQLENLASLEPTENKFLIDVSGYVTNVGRTTSRKQAPKLLISIWQIRVVNAKHYNNKLYLSSSSSTLIYDDPEIPALKDLKVEMSHMELIKVALPVDQSVPKDGTLENPATMGPQSKKQFTIDAIRTRKGWNCPSCGDTKCRKGATRKEGKYRLELDVFNGTKSSVVVLFDESGMELVGCSAESIMEAENEASDDNPTVPRTIANLIGTTHTLELKSHTYYEHGTFESFTCWKIIPAQSVDKGASLSTELQAIKAHRLKDYSDAEITTVEDEDPDAVEDGSTPEKREGKKVCHG
ncbi:hypothetical protein OROMI_023102 [Orobanche minor]